jgi:glycosyltransferase involved in cell wall biosynthesis
MNPVATICIPTHAERRLPYLREAVASARAQTCSDIEILISNDDCRVGVLRDFAGEQARVDRRVRYRQNEQRLGLGGNWNAVANDARGTYLVIIGDDDRLLPTFVETLVAAGRPDAAVVFANHHVIDANGDRLEALTHQFLVSFGRATLSAGVVRDPVACVWRNSVPMSSALIRTAEVQRLGIKADLNTPEIELYARLAAEGQTFVFVPEYLGEYRVHPQAITVNGLVGERLIKYLEPIEVPVHVEPLKRAFMGEILLSSVSGLLKQGDLRGARAMMRHRYYPSLVEQPKRVMAYGAIGLLPASLARRALTTAASLRQRVRRSLRSP